jgi:selenocysteine-specific elongation factor
LARPPDAIRRSIQKSARTNLVVALGDLAVLQSALRQLEPKILALVAAFHKEHTFKAGISLAELCSRIGRSVPPPVIERAASSLVGMKKLELGPEGFKQPGHAPFAAAGGDARARIVKRLEEAGIEPPAIDALEKELALPAKDFRELVASLARAGEIVRAGELYFAKKAFDSATERVLAAIDQRGELSTADAKTILGLSRKFLIPLLEAMDKAQITVRVGEVRKKRKA